MHKAAHIYITIAVFVAFFLLYFFVPIPGGADLVFLTISTFLFAIFTGFFISRQGTRYSSIRDKITAFDGNMTFVYRTAGHFGGEHQKEAGEILNSYYKEILKNKSWDYPLTHKTTILTALQELLTKISRERELSGADNMMLNRMVEALRDAQQSRKTLIALYQERVPQSQWVLIYFLTAMLLITLSTIPSLDVAINALLKTAFATSTVFVMMLLHQFDRLRFFEGTIGEHSAQDVLDIIAGAK